MIITDLAFLVEGNEFEAGRQDKGMSSTIENCNDF